VSERLCAILLGPELDSRKREPCGGSARSGIPTWRTFKHCRAVKLKDLPVPGMSAQLAAAIKSAGAGCLDDSEVRRLIWLARIELVSRRGRRVWIYRLGLVGALLFLMALGLAIASGVYSGPNSEPSPRMRVVIVALAASGLAIVIVSALRGDMDSPDLKWEIGPLPDPPEDLRNFSSYFADTSDRLRKRMPEANLLVYRLGRYRLLAVSRPIHGTGFVAAWNIQPESLGKPGPTPAAVQLTITALSRR
jgi:hypothetical protein